MKTLLSPRVLAVALAFVAGSLYFSQTSIAVDRDKPNDETAVRQKPNHEDATWLFAHGRLTREPWKAFDPLETPTTGESEEEGKDGEFEGHVDERLEWFLKQRTYPFESLPEGARARAWNAREEGSNRTAGGLPLAWRAIGPRPTLSDFPANWGATSGRINAIAVSPADSNLLLVGAATGGIWRSTNGGVSFAPVSDAQVDLAVGSIVFAPSNPQIVYAGMGDAAGGYLGSGILRSTDAGATWTRVSNSTLPSPGTIARIAVDPTDADRLYVAQYSLLSGSTVFSSGFFVSTNGGVSFTKTMSALPRDVVQHPTDPNILYLGVTRYDSGSPNTGGVFKSTNKGATWTRVYTVPFASGLLNVKVAVTPATPEAVYVVSASGSTVALEVSPDGGATWAARGAAVDPGQFSYNCYLFVHPTNPNTIFIGTRDLWRTTDGGTSYTNITNNFSVAGSYNPTVARSHPDQHHFYISPTNPNTFYVANDGGLSRTNDGGSTFASLNGSLGLTMFTSLAVHPTAGLRMYGGTQDNGNQRRQSSGTAWEEFQSGDGGQINLDVLDPSILYVTYVRHTIWRYTNHGSNFAATIGTTAAFNNDTRIAFYPPLVGNETNSNIYFGTYRLYVSTNRGASWTAPGGTTDLTNGSGVLSAIAVSKSDNNTIYTGASDGRVMVSTNAGANWTDRTAGLPTRFVKSITIDPTNPNTAYVTFSGFLTGHVYKTVNGGQNWTNISGNLPDIPVNTLAADPRPGNANTIYVGTDIGVFRTLNGGTNWETFNNGMPPVIVTELAGQANGLLVASTYGRGAYEINLNGAAPALFDYEADRKADLSIFRPSNNTWYVLGASGFKVLTWGETGDKLAPADYDGDGETDLAVFRPSNGVWYMYLSGTETFATFGWGQNGDVPIPTDRDGDGTTDLVVYRESNNTWYARSIVSGPISSTVFGIAGDKPVRGDFDGDGRGDNAIFRPSDSTWYIQKSTVGFFVQTWGQAGDTPTPADFDGDGATDLAIFRQSTGQWYLSRSTDGFAVVNWGQAGDAPIPADYDGDGKSDPAVFRPGNATWYMNQSAAGFLALPFGQAGDVPTPTAFIY